MYLTPQHYHYTLEFPNSLPQLVGSTGALVVQMEVAIRQEEGWQEEVSYMEGSRFKFHSDYKTWVDAEAVCVSEGGHLATIMSLGELEEVGKFPINLWNGGRYSTEDRIWTWTSGEVWGWESKEPTDNRMCGQVTFPSLNAWDCNSTKQYVCESVDVKKVASNQTLTLKYANSFFCDVFAPYCQQGSSIHMHQC